MARLLYLPFLFLGVFKEELVCRGYLLTRLSGLFGSRTRALAVSSLVFALPHIYQGASGVFTSFVFGWLMGIVLLIGRRLWPLVLAHFFYDLWAMGYFDLFGP